MQSTYLLKLTVRLTLQFVSVSPLNVHLGQTRSLGLKVWGGHKTFLVGQDFVFVIYFNKKCSWQNKIWRITKNLGGLPLNASRDYRSDSNFPDTSLNQHYLTKQSSSDKRGLTVVTEKYKESLSASEKL